MMSEAPHGATRERGRWARWIPAGMIMVGVLELALLLLIGKATSVWWVLAIIALGWVVGMALVVAAGQQSWVRLRSAFRAFRGTGDLNSHLSRPVFTLLAAACFFFPGVLTDLLAIVLLMIPVQKKVARRVVAGRPGDPRRQLYRRSSGGVIDGEIIIDGSSSQPRGGSTRATPPVIEP